MKKSKSTMVELVTELEKLPQTPEIIEMIAEARAGEYHDYKNKKYDCGKVESYNRLMALGHPELATRIRDGEFDEDADAADIAEMKTYAPAELHKSLGLDLGLTEQQKKDIETETKISQWLGNQRMQASAVVQQAHSQIKGPEDWSAALTQLEMFATNMLATVFSNRVKNGSSLAELIEQHKRLITVEMNWVAENCTVVPPPFGSKNG